MQLTNFLTTALLVASAIASPINVVYVTKVVTEYEHVQGHAAPTPANFYHKYAGSNNRPKKHGKGKKSPKVVYVTAPAVVWKTVNGPVPTPKSHPKPAAPKPNPVDTSDEGSDSYGQPEPTTKAPEPTTKAPKPTPKSPKPETPSGGDTPSGNFGLDPAEILKLHNDFRAKYNTPPLVWDNTVAESALKHVNYCTFEHTGQGSLSGIHREFGQNLWTSNTEQVDMKSAFSSWAEGELKYYNGAFSHEAGHLSQVLWKSTTKLGCAMKQCDSISHGVGGKGFILTCEYDPAGNVQGQFQDNVNL